jgi:hypothetical protein
MTIMNLFMVVAPRTTNSFRQKQEDDEMDSTFSKPFSDRQDTPVLKSDFSDMCCTGQFSLPALLVHRQ